MKENIEEDINVLKNCWVMTTEHELDKNNMVLKAAIKNTVKDYERLLKENEQLHKFILEGITIENSPYQNYQLDFLRENFIPVQKVKAKIEELNDVSNAEELEDTMDGKNYTITELVQYVLQELLESEE